MIFSKISVYAEKSFNTFFLLFLFCSAIFCGYTRVNNLFHLSMLCFLGMLASNPILRRQLFNNRQFNTGLSLISLMLSYFCLTTLWSSQKNNLVSNFTHAFYVLLFIIMYRYTVLKGHRLMVLWAAVSGIIVLVTLTFLTVNIQTILNNRLINSFFGAPDNVIDLAGYFALGIFISLIIIRDTSTCWLYFPVAVLLLALLLTQSRGPFLSFFCALAILLNIRSSARQYRPVIILLIGAGVIAILFITPFSEIFLKRFASSYQHSFVRFGIWHYTLKLAAQKPFFGWGVNEQLSFVNVLGDTISTTHSLYLAALLKGGLVGMLLLILVISYGLIMAKQQCELHQGLEGALFLFVVGFYLTHGMFVISNPNVSWYMFWLPMAIVLTLPLSISQAEIVDRAR